MILIDLPLLIAEMNVKVGGGRVGVMYIVVTQWHNYQKTLKGSTKSFIFNVLKNHFGK